MAESILLPESLIDGVGPEPRAKVAVVVEENTIREVMPLERLGRTRREGAKVIEAPGHTLMPGLIDAHVHLVFDRYPSMQAIDQASIESATLTAARNARLLLSHGYTTVRDVGSRGAASLSVARAVREGLVEGPRIFSGGQLISTTAGTADSYAPWISNTSGIGVVVDGVEAIRAEVRRQAKMGASHIKLGLSGSEPSVYSYTWMTTMSEEEVAIAIAEATRMNLRVACHAESEDGALFAARWGATSIEHGTRLTEEAADLMLRNGTTLVPTLCTLHSVLELGEELGLGRKQRQEMEVNRDPWLHSTRMAHEMGIPIAAGGDVGNRYRQGENAKEIGFLMEAGLSPMEALQAATSVAASVVGAAGRLGVVTANAEADLVLFHGEPLDDLAALEDSSRFTAVMRSGRWVKGDPTTSTELVKGKGTKT